MKSQFKPNKSADQANASMEPVLRRCCGCGEEDAADGLLRFAYVKELATVVPDLDRSAGHRGMHVHATRSCLRLACSRGGFSRAAKGGVSVEFSDLLQRLEIAFDRKVRGLLLAAIRTRSFVYGFDATKEAISEGKIAALVVAVDAGDSMERMLSYVDPKLPRAMFADRATLGALVGRSEVSVIGITDRRIASEVVRNHSRAASVSEAE